MAVVCTILSTPPRCVLAAALSGTLILAACGKIGQLSFCIVKGDISRQKSLLDKTAEIVQILNSNICIQASQHWEMCLCVDVLIKGEDF